MAMSGGGAQITSELCLLIASEMGAGVPLSKPFEMDAFLGAVDRALTLRGGAEK